MILLLFDKCSHFFQRLSLAFGCNIFHDFLNLFLFILGKRMNLTLVLILALKLGNAEVTFFIFEDAPTCSAHPVFLFELVNQS